MKISIFFILFFPTLLWHSLIRSRPPSLRPFLVLLFYYYFLFIFFLFLGYDFCNFIIIYKQKRVFIWTKARKEEEERFIIIVDGQRQSRNLSVEGEEKPQLYLRMFNSNSVVHSSFYFWVFCGMIIMMMMIMVKI